MIERILLSNMELRNVQIAPEQVKEVLTLWHQVRNGALSRVEFQVRMEPVQQQVKELLQAGSRSTHPKTRHTCQNILKLWESLRKKFSLGLKAKRAITAE